jgi:energy-coupling factor transporter ATP-binding protein EcfA2
MSIKLQRVRVEGLFNTFEMDVPIEDNTLILVGENGSGKSTLINLIYYALTTQWNRLADLPFTSLSITINDEDYKISREDLIGYRKKDDLMSNFEVRLSKKQLDNLLEILAQHPSEYWASSVGLNQLRNLSRSYPPRGISFRSLLELSQINPSYNIQDNSSISSDLHIKNLEEVLQVNGDEQVLFLPTYRRIEKELSDVIPDLNLDETFFFSERKRRADKRTAYIELVEFGMTDVVKIFDLTLKELDQSFRSELNLLTGSYLHDILQGLYRNVDVSQLTTDEVAETVESMLSRIGEEILSEDDRIKLKNLIQDLDDSQDLNDEQRISAHFIASLLKIHKAQREREIPVRNLTELINKYLSKKNIEFNSTTFELSIRRTDIDQHFEVPLHGLSSGEKQIVSLFSHVFLSGYKNYFVVIDEPELSISVLWQKRFLQDLKDTNKCSGLIAVTHSPFVFDNSLSKYAHSISEFIRES